MEKATMKKPITIFVTAYNVSPYLERFFENLSRQTFTDYELLMFAKVLGTSLDWLTGQG